jgi:hypothetical protein
MVQWKGEITKDKSGGRAAKLESLEDFQVPNFFTVTREETKKLIDDAETKEEILNQKIDEDLKEQIKDAYSDINVSSEVRNASGKARNLVEGQRNGGRVSVRISDQQKGVYKYQINVGSSELIDAVKKAVASYFAAGEQEQYPAVIVQRMIEAEASGAAVTSYLGEYQLFESVKGLGTALEEGETVPDAYLLKDGEIVEKDIPDEQIETTINPMSGEPRKKQVRRHKSIFRDSEIKKIIGKLERTNYDIKFAYKRGTFYVVDAFEPEGSNPFNSEETDLTGIRAETGKIEGVIGDDIQLSNKAEFREEKPLISRKGGYTSTAGQKARNNDIPAIFRFNGELKEGQKVRADPKSVEVEEIEQNSGKRFPNRKGTQQFQQHRNNQQQQQQRTRSYQTQENNSDSSVNATEVVPVNSGNGLYMQPPYKGRYAVTDAQAANTIPPRNFLKNYADIFGFDGEKAILDVRNLDRRGIENAISYLEADLKILLLNRPEQELIGKAVESGFDVIAVNPGMVDQTRQIVSREEKRFIMEKLRKLDQ